MPVIDLGSVVGPQGEQGNTGPQGEQGVAGPSLISASTQTTLTGVLAGDGNTVGVRAVNTTPTANSTNLITSGGVYTALTDKASLDTISADVEETAIASRAYVPGEYYIYKVNGGLYRITANVSAGTTLANGTNCIRTYVSSEFGKFELVYTNQSTTSAFSTQTVEIANINDYDFLIVGYKSHINAGFGKTMVAPVLHGATYGIMEPFWSGNNAAILVYRSFGVNASGTGTKGLIFDMGYYRSMSATSSSGSNDYVIPTKIYGIKA